MAVRIMIERDADATLARGDGCAATRAEWPLRTAAGARHGIEGQRFPRERLALPSRCHLAAAEPIQFSWRASAGRGKVGKLSPCRLLATRDLLPSTAMQGQGDNMNDNPLPSWADGAAKSSILDFVTRVTKEGGPSYVRPAA
jgi:hypothetical protein